MHSANRPQHYNSPLPIHNPPNLNQPNGDFFPKLRAHLQNIFATGNKHPTSCALSWDRSCMRNTEPSAGTGPAHTDSVFLRPRVLQYGINQHLGTAVGLGLSGESHLEQSRPPVLYRDQKGFLSVSVKKDQIATLERDKTSPLENSQSPL